MIDRLPNENPAGLDDEQMRFVDAITRGPWGSLRGPLGVLLQAPSTGFAFEPLARHFRLESRLPANLRELVILIGAAHWRVPFEWRSHVDLARTAGLAEEDIRAIGEGRAPVRLNSAERYVHDLSVALLHTGRVDEETFERARDAVGVPMLVELSLLTGFYTMIGLLLNAFEVGLRSEEDMPWKTQG